MTLTGSGDDIHEFEDSIGNRADVRTRPSVYGSIVGVVGDESADILTVETQGWLGHGGAPDLDFRSGRVQMSFDENEVAIGVDRIEGGVKIVALNRRNEYGRGLARDEASGRSSGRPVPMAILAGNVDLVIVVRVLDRADAVAASGEFFDEFADEHCFARIFAPDDVKAFQMRLRE